MSRPEAVAAMVDPEHRLKNRSERLLTEDHVAGAEVPEVVMK